ncbi:hypothetical protein JOD20_005323, partial [Herpetosiphon giganteus]|nr:hypothetical protein [Herpetosiphon giganteus]MBM7846659.1 hypothetical protein [Herpetosiphon giganteus]
QGRGLDGLSPTVYTQRLLNPMGSAEGI